jgi:hypothetical protein
LGDVKVLAATPAGVLVNAASIQHQVPGILKVVHNNCGNFLYLNKNFTLQL